MARGITERLARACAAHPRRTLAAWGAAVVVALVLVATALHGLTSNAHVVGSPESTKATKAIAEGIPADAGRPEAAGERRRRRQLLPLPGRQPAVPGSRLAPRRAASYRGQGRQRAQLPLRQPVARLARRACDPRPALRRQRRRDQAGAAVRAGGERHPRLRRRDHGRPHGRKRLQHALSARPRARRARLRAAGRARRAPPRLRRRRRRAGPGADGDPLDPGRSRPRRVALARVRPLGVHREHAHRDGARARDRLLAVRHLALPRGADAWAREDATRSASPARRRAGPCSSAAAPSSSPCSGCCSCRRRSCAASPPARSSSASSRSPRR